MDSSNTKYLYVVSIGAAAVLGPAMSLLGFQTSIGVKGALGSINSIVYGVFYTLSALLLYSQLAAALGRKNTLIIGEAGTLIFTIAMFYPTWWTLIPSAVVQGFCAAIVWSASGAMAASICRDNSEMEYDKRKLQQNMAIYSTIVAFGEAAAYLIAEASFTGLQGQASGVDPLNDTQTYDISQCGANDCPIKYSFEKESAIFKNLVPSRASIYVLLSIYGCLQIAAVILHGTLLANDKTDLTNRRNDETNSLVPRDRKTSILGTCSKVTKEIFSIRGILIIPTQLQFGLLATFIPSGFNRAFLSCAIGVEHVGSHAGVINVASCITNIALSFLSPKIHPSVANITALMTELLSYIVALYWIPSPENLYTTYVLSSLFGIAYGTRRYVSLTTAAALSHDVDAGNAILTSFVGVAAIINFSWATPLCVHTILYVLISHSVFAAMLLSVALYLYS